MRPLDIGETETISALLTRGFYSMAFQPIIELPSARPFGFEALMRGPAGTLLECPCKLFNQEGYIDVELLTRIDNACIGSAIRTAKMLPFDCLLFLNIHGNTLRHLEAKDFLERLRRVKMDPARIVLEVSEKTSQDHVEEIADRLKEFREYGIRVALDDVGSSNPWLMHMLCLEPEFMKLDRVLIQDIDTHPRKQALIHGLSLLANRMGARLIAEGIETCREYRMLEQLNVPFVQGFFMGKAQPAENWLLFENGRGQDTFYSLGCPVPSTSCGTAADLQYDSATVT